jgi:hypothetical protein
MCSKCVGGIGFNAKTFVLNFIKDVNSEVSLVVDITQ